MPMGTAIGSFVQSGPRAGTARHRDDVVGIPAPNSAKIQVSRIRRNGALLPEIAVVFAPEDDPICAACPSDT
jgi:hypothetical protein